MRTPRHRATILALTAALTLTLGTAAGATIVGGNVHHNPTPTLHPASVIVRLGPSGYAHAGSNHAMLNVDDVVFAANGDLEVHRTPLPGEKIATCLAGEDETLAAMGVEAGCSGGAAVSIIRFYRDGVKVRADSPLFTSNANVWVRIDGVVIP